MKSALILGATVMPNGRMLVRVGCPFCARIHIHALLRGHSDCQAPSCGTPAVYAIRVERPPTVPARDSLTLEQLLNGDADTSAAELVDAAL